MADLVTLLNTIRANASAEYQDRVPEATQTNISSVGNPILSYQSTQNEFLNALVDRIAMTVVRSKIAQNPLAILKKGGIPLGKDVQEIYTNMTKGDDFDTTTKTLLTKATPDVHAIYHRRNRKGQYVATITRQQLATAFVSYTDLENLITSVINSLYSGDNYDEFLLMKNLISSGITGKKIKALEVAEPTTEAGAKDFIKALRVLSTNFTFPSSAYNSYAENDSQERKITTWTPVEDQIIILSSEVNAMCDVEVLAKAFNLDKATFLAQSLVIDNFGDDKTLALICDKALFQVYDNLNEMTNFYNPQGLYINYYWNHWQTYSLSLFANAIALQKPAA